MLGSGVSERRAGEPSSLFQEDLWRPDTVAGRCGRSKKKLQLGETGAGTRLNSKPKNLLRLPAHFKKFKNPQSYCSKSRTNLIASVLSLPNHKWKLKRPHHSPQGSVSYCLTSNRLAAAAASAFPRPQWNEELRSKQDTHPERPCAVLGSGVGTVNCSLPFSSGTRIAPETAGVTKRSHRPEATVPSSSSS